ncbi:acyltransferase [Janthinobacterium sp. DSP2-3-3]|uniref:acyltransferase n=1 Tax=Janthinobacterium sp. DSP2-3-3 TaxID=2804596 RepID=UPI003CF5665B
MSQFIVIGEGKVVVAASAKIAPTAQIIFHAPGTVTIGDYCVIGPGVKFICAGGDVMLGDWSTLHENCLVLSGQGTQIGAHCWFGQNSIIDGTGGISIGRGVRVGMYSQLWSHVAAGEQIEGCTLYGERPVVIEDNVWLVGSCIVASGVTIGARTVALIGSNITKSCGANIVIAGSPAVQKSNMSFYREITLNEKWQLLDHWLDEIAADLHLRCDKDILAGITALREVDDSAAETIMFVRDTTTAAAQRLAHLQSTVCCVEDKTYTKCRSGIEYKVLKALASNKARFDAVVSQ